MALQHCDLLYSLPLDAADPGAGRRVFSGPRGCGAATGPADHRAHSPTQPGRVELWPFLPKPDKPEEGPWDDPVDAPPPDDPGRGAGPADRRRRSPAGSPERRALAAGGGRPGDPRRRRPDPGAAARRGVPRGDPGAEAGAGAGRRRRSAPHRRRARRARTCCGARGSAATPQRRPVARRLPAQPARRHGEAELFELAHGAGPVASGRRSRPRRTERWAASRALLRTSADRRTSCGPSSFYAGCLCATRARRQLIARLGAEAEDGIDALLDQALDYERVRGAEPDRLPRWIDRDEVTSSAGPTTAPTRCG